MKFNTYEMILHNISRTVGQYLDGKMILHVQLNFNVNGNGREKCKIPSIAKFLKHHSLTH